MRRGKMVAGGFVFYFAMIIYLECILGMKFNPHFALFL